MHRCLRRVTTFKEFGKLVKWGHGDQEARARILTVTRNEMEEKGVTRDIASAWRDGYRKVANETPSNPSAAGRADLMQYIVDSFGG